MIELDTHSATATVLRVDGRLTMVDAAAFRSAVTEALGDGGRTVVVDLAGCEFMDSSGLHLVVRWANEASKDGFLFELEPGPPAVQRIFDLTAVHDSLPWRKQD